VLKDFEIVWSRSAASGSVLCGTHGPSPFLLMSLPCRHLSLSNHWAVADSGHSTAKLCELRENRFMGDGMRDIISALIAQATCAIRASDA
jgi:hypothetical protein